MQPASQQHQDTVYFSASGYRNLYIMIQTGKSYLLLDA